MSKPDSFIAASRRLLQEDEEKKAAKAKKTPEAKPAAKPSGDSSQGGSGNPSYEEAVREAHDHVFNQVKDLEIPAHPNKMQLKLMKSRVTAALTTPKYERTLGLIRISGNTGIGKTSTIENAVLSVPGITEDDVVMLNAGADDMEVIISGIPTVIDGKVSDAKVRKQLEQVAHTKLSNAKVIFIDEYNRVSHSSISNAIMALINEGKVAGARLPSLRVVFAAYNPYTGADHENVTPMSQADRGRNPFSFWMDPHLEPQYITKRKKGEMADPMTTVGNPAKWGTSDAAAHLVTEIWHKVVNQKSGPLANIAHELSPRAMEYLAAGVDQALHLIALYNSGDRSEAENRSELAHLVNSLIEATLHGDITTAPASARTGYDHNATPIFSDGEIANLKAFCKQVSDMILPPADGVKLKDWEDGSAKLSENLKQITGASALPDRVHAVLHALSSTFTARSEYAVKSSEIPPNALSWAVRAPVKLWKFSKLLSVLLEDGGANGEITTAWFEKSGDIFRRLLTKPEMVTNNPEDIKKLKELGEVVFKHIPELKNAADA